MSIRSILKKNKFIYNSYLKKKYFNSKYIFENRSKNSDTLCYILAGYKEFTWSIIFDRIKKIAPKNIDICILSSGVYSNKLSKIAKDNNWSYLSVNKNCVTLAQNIVLKKFDKAENIYKLDEDIFITKDFFKQLKYTYEEVNKRDYNVGFVAPLIPINGYGHAKILKKLNLINIYEEKFEPVKYAAGRERMIESSPEVAKFMWGEGGFVPQIDELSTKLNKMPFTYSACSIRFSIGAIFFKRELWESMRYFKVEKGSCMGLDETQMCSYCICNSKAMIISENVCVGHLSFGTQNQPMEEYFKNNIEIFKLKSK